MWRDPWKGLVALAALAALFAWSARAGAAAAGVIAAWIAAMATREALQRRSAKRRLSDRLGHHGLPFDAVFHNWNGIAAIAIAGPAGKIAFESSEGSELYGLEAVLEARARRLPQGGYELAVSVPGRVSGKPYWHRLIVKRVGLARRWSEVLAPILGSRLSIEGLD